MVLPHPSVRKYFSFKVKWSLLSIRSQTHIVHFRSTIFTHTHTKPTHAHIHTHTHTHTHTNRHIIHTHKRTNTHTQAADHDKWLQVGGTVESTDVAVTMTDRVCLYYGCTMTVRPHRV